METITLTLAATYKLQQDARIAAGYAYQQQTDEAEVEAAELRTQVLEAQEQVGGLVVKCHNDNIETLEARVVTVNRKALKLRQDGVTLVKSNEVEYATETIDGEEVEHAYTYYTLAGSLPKVPGFTFLATIEHTEAGNIVRVVPSADVNVVEYRNVDPRCDHCNMIRSRKDTYLVNNDKGETVQVGRTCLKDFTGSDNPEQIARFASWLSDELEDIRESSGSGRGEACWEIIDFVAQAARLVREQGYVSGTYAYEYGGVATGREALDTIFNRTNTMSKEAREHAIAMMPENEDIERAEQVMEWARDIDADTDSDYLHNLRVACLSDSITSRRANIVASAIRGYERHIEKKIKAEAKAKALNEYVGTVGERLRDLDLTLVNRYAFDGMYGTTYLENYADDKGRTFIWRGKGSDAYVGQKVTLTGTVKEHSEFRETKQTVLTRCKATVQESDNE